MVYRFLIAVLLTLAMLTNLVAGVQCTSSGIDSNSADCCKDGMCPHHLSAEQTESCPHTLSPDASLSLTVLNALPATIDEATVGSIQLEQVGPANEMPVPAIIQPVIFPFTPPPEL